MNRPIRTAVERSSLGTSKAAKARSTVPAKTAARIVRNANSGQHVWGVQGRG